MKTKRKFSAWFTNDLDEVTFEGRNKVYGAYELRRHYPDRLQLAFFITILFIFSIWCTTNLGLSLSTQEIFSSEKTVPTVLDHPPFVIEPHRVAQSKSVIPKKQRDMPAVSVISDSLIEDDLKEAIKDDLTNAIDRNDEGRNSDNDLSSYGEEDEKQTMNGNTASGETNSLGSNEIIHAPAVMPSFPGEKNALEKYLQKHLRCSQYRQSAGRGGKLIVSFIVSAEGNIYGVEILKDDVGFGCAEEAVRLLEGMPKWNAGMNNNHPVNVKLVLPIAMETTGK